MVANQQAVQELTNLTAALARQISKLLEIVQCQEMRIAALERKVRDAS